MFPSEIEGFPPVSLGSVENSSSQHEDIDTFRAGAEKGATAFVNCGAGRVNVVGQQDGALAYALRSGNCKSPSNVPSSFDLVELNLRACGTATLQDERIDRNASRSCKGACQQLGLIEAAPAQAGQVEGDGNEHVVGRKIEGALSKQDSGKRLCELDIPAVLVSLERGFQRVRTCVPGIVYGARTRLTKVGWMSEASAAEVICAIRCAKRQATARAEWGARYLEACLAGGAEGFRVGAGAAAGACGWIQQVKRRLPKMPHGRMLRGAGGRCNACPYRLCSVPAAFPRVHRRLDDATGKRFDCLGAPYYIFDARWLWHEAFSDRIPDRRRPHVLLFAKCGDHGVEHTELVQQCGVTLPRR